MTKKPSESMDEVELRDFIFAHLDEAIKTADEPDEVIPPKRLQQMLSLRLEPEIVAKLREIANTQGVSVSDLLREGVDHVIEEWSGAMVTAQVSFTSSVSTGVKDLYKGFYFVNTAVPSVQTNEPAISA